MRIIEIVREVAPRCYPNYLQAFENGDALFNKYGLNRPYCVAHFLAQALYETGTVLRKYVVHDARQAPPSLRHWNPFGCNPT
jgi:hypothetical protein